MKRILLSALCCAWYVCAMAQFDTPLPPPTILPSMPGAPVVEIVKPQEKELPDSLITFADSSIKDFCVNFLKGIDTNHDGEVSKAEALRVKKLGLTPFKSFMRVIGCYDDLRWFPNIEDLSAGMTPLDTLDLRHNPLLRRLDVRDCRQLKVIILAPGCKPEIEHSYWKGEPPKTIIAKDGE